MIPDPSNVPLVQLTPPPPISSSSLLTILPEKLRAAPPIYVMMAFCPGTSMTTSSPAVGGALSLQLAPFAQSPPPLVIHVSVDSIHRRSRGSQAHRVAR